MAGEDGMTEGECLTSGGHIYERIDDGGPSGWLRQCWRCGHKTDRPTAPPRPEGDRLRTEHGYLIRSQKGEVAMAEHRHCNSDPIECNVDASMGQAEAALEVLTSPNPEYGNDRQRIDHAASLLRTMRIPSAREVSAAAGQVHSAPPPTDTQQSGPHPFGSPEVGGVMPAGGSTTWPERSL